MPPLRLGDDALTHHPQATRHLIDIAGADRVVIGTDHPFDMGALDPMAEKIDLQIVPAARRMFERAEAAGWGKDDASRVIEVYESKDRQLPAQ